MNDDPDKRKRRPGAPRPGRREREAGRSLPPGEAAQTGGRTGERIAKRLARAGIASRRDAEGLIAAGRVKVNGRVLASPAFNVEPADVIELDGEAIPPIERTRLFLFHKPAGLVTSNRDPEGRRTIFDTLPKELPRLITIGRLDINTEGLLLLTNDGGLARTLELPATGWLRRYRVRVHGRPDEQALAGLSQGIAVDGVFYGAVEAELDRIQGSNAWLTIGLREGKNREVKAILGALGLDVTRLIRVSFGPFQLGELGKGEVVEIKGRTLRDQLGARLIAQSGANFEADITKPFSAKERRHPAPRDAAPKGRRPTPEEPLRVGEGGLIKKPKWRRDSRAEALQRLSTKGPSRGKPERGDSRSGRTERVEPGRTRSSNVWMAPGARPLGKAAAAKAAVAGKAGSAGTGPRPGRGPKKAERPGRPKPNGPRPGGQDRPRGKRGGPGADRRR